MGFVIETLLNHEFDLFGVLVCVDHDEVFPQRVVGGQPLESLGDLAQDIGQEVVVIVRRTIR